MVINGFVSFVIESSICSSSFFSTLYFDLMAHFVCLLSKQKLTHSYIFKRLLWWTLFFFHKLTGIVIWKLVQNENGFCWWTRRLYFVRWKKWNPPFHCLVWALGNNSTWRQSRIGFHLFLFSKFQNPFHLRSSPSIHRIRW